MKNKDRYDTLVETCEDLGKALVEIDLYQSSIDGVCRELENNEETNSYNRSKVKESLETLESFNYLSTYSASLKEEYELEQFNEEDYKQLMEEVEEAESKDTLQATLPAEDIIPGIYNVS
ncbi:MAG: hypothetical protein BRC29_00240 [Nanohaloarchaea archaeon SW_7_43_1]|nr:MAG: hypothetical protein BRC29_00240 [Nanohaloarchaea archaeon SW_7_43_1]